MTAKWTQGTLCIIPENLLERDALLQLWNLRKDYRLPIDSDDFGADGITNDTFPIQAAVDGLVSLQEPQHRHLITG
jgi:hypothetical protein